MWLAEDKAVCCHCSHEITNLSPKLLVFFKSDGLDQAERSTSLSQADKLLLAALQSTMIWSLPIGSCFVSHFWQMKLEFQLMVGIASCLESIQDEPLSYKWRGALPSSPDLQTQIQIQISQTSFDVIQCYKCVSDIALSHSWCKNHTMIEAPSDLIISRTLCTIHEPDLFQGILDALLVKWSSSPDLGRPGWQADAQALHQLPVLPSRPHHWQVATLSVGQPTCLQHGPGYPGPSPLLLPWMWLHNPCRRGWPCHNHYEWLHNLRKQQWSGQSCQDFENISNSNLSQRIFYDSHVSQTCSAKRNSNMCCGCNVYHSVCLVLVTSVQLYMTLFVYSCKLYTVVYKHGLLEIEYGSLSWK